MLVITSIIASNVTPLIGGGVSFPLAMVSIKNNTQQRQQTTLVLVNKTHNHTCSHTFDCLPNWLS